MNKPTITISFKNSKGLEVGEETLKRDVHDFYLSLSGMVDLLLDGRELKTTLIKQGNLIFDLKNVDFILLTDKENE